MKGPGRPKTKVDPEKLCTVEKAVELLREFLTEKYHDEAIVERMSYKKGSLYNMLSQRRLERYGTRRCALINIEELFKLVS